MRERIRFTVTDEDIRLGRRENGTRCPVARALRVATGEPWFVDHEVAYLNTPTSSLNYRPSRSTARFIRAFDARKGVEPFTGEVWR